MATLVFELDFRSAEPQNPDRIQMPPVAKIYLKTSTLDEQGRVLVTSECMSIDEIEGEIDQLQIELEDIRKKVRMMFQR